MHARIRIQASAARACPQSKAPHQSCGPPTPIIEADSLQVSPDPAGAASLVAAQSGQSDLAFKLGVVGGLSLGGKLSQAENLSCETSIATLVGTSLLSGIRLQLFSR